MWMCADLIHVQFSVSQLFGIIRIGWPSLKGCLKLQVIFCKRATNTRALLRKITYKDKASYDSTPPCIVCSTVSNELTFVNFYLPPPAGCLDAECAVSVCALFRAVLVHGRDAPSLCGMSICVSVSLSVSVSV